MNRLEIKNAALFNYWDGRYLCHEAQIVIDGVFLGDYIDSAVRKEKLQYDYDSKLLALTFSPGLDFEYCDRFMEKILAEHREAVIPILLCDGDMDFTCTTVTAKMRFDESYAYWDEIGFVTGNYWSLDDRAYGISYTESYSDEDWQRYGDNIALEKVGSPKWRDWVSENFQEEHYRRLCNGYYPFLQRKENIKVFAEPHWKFCLSAYGKMLDFFRSREDIRDIHESCLPVL
ncbi:MAG: hypothetical protein ACI4J5_07450 [Oscillospiraceae bacterium]